MADKQSGDKKEPTPDEKYMCDSQGGISGSLSPDANKSAAGKDRSLLSGFESSQRENKCSVRESGSCSVSHSQWGRPTDTFGQGERGNYLSRVAK